MNKLNPYVIVIVCAMGIGGAVAVMMLPVTNQSRGTSVYSPNTKITPNQTSTQTNTSSTTPNAQTTSIQWQQTPDGWRSTGTVPSCPDPITLKTPADLSKATAILYPGQVRGGNYKPHGGFIFKNSKNDAITVSAPLDAVVWRGSRYIEQGETQYMFDFMAPCGVAYRLDHLQTLSPAFQQIANTLPEAKVDQSQTTNLNSPVAVKAGDPIATAVGFAKTSNTSFDWGVYDLRQKNTASQDAAWAAAHQPSELAHYGVCWFDWLSADDEAKVRSLPAGDATSGKKSDYCK